MKDERKPIYKGRKPFAKKSFGQNFLVDENYIDEIISALNPQAEEIIVEIGAGRGALTEKLIETGAKVVAIELERRMLIVLQKEFSGMENFQLVEADALKVDYQALADANGAKSKIKLVANLPYYISTAILQKLIEQREVFSELILMFQREVVERITAAPGNSERGYLTVLTEAYLEAEKLFDVPPDAFEPAPKVWSAIVRLTPKENQIENEKSFLALISAGFGQKRKTILNNLKSFLPATDMKTLLEECEIAIERRAESLTLNEWKRLCHLITLRK